MCGEGEHGAGAFGGVRHEKHEAVPGFLRHARHPDGDFTVTIGGVEEKVKVLGRVEFHQRLGEERDGVRHDLIDHDDEVAVVVVLVGLDQVLPAEAGFVASSVERCDVSGGYTARWVEMRRVGGRAGRCGGGMSSLLPRFRASIAVRRRRDQSAVAGDRFGGAGSTLESGDIVVSSSSGGLQLPDGNARRVTLIACRRVNDAESE